MKTALIWAGIVPLLWFAVATHGASAAGGAVVVAGYFLYQAVILQMGTVAAAKEVPFNVIQALSGLIGVPVYMLVARAYPPLSRWVRQG